MDRQAIEEQLKRQGGTIKELSPITKFLFVICTAVLSILFGGPVYIAVISAVYIILSLFAHVFKGFLNRILSFCFLWTYAYFDKLIVSKCRS